jgi:DNA N-6-adenine-methyltransferase (Dam)
MPRELIVPEITLPFYNNARTALAKACSVDEVKKIKGAAEQLKVAAKISKDKKMLADAEEIRDRAVRLIGQLMKAQAKTVGLAKRGLGKKSGLKNNPQKSVPTLDEAGIDKNLANRARKLAALDDKAFEAKVETWRDNMMADETSFVVGDMFRPPLRGTQGTGNNEWHTPQEFVDLARAVLGIIDLDPASNAVAQRTVKAKTYFTAARNGLTKEWRGRVYLNPPFSQSLIAPFVAKLIAERRAGNVTEAIMLTNNYTDTEWFHSAAAAADAICFTKGRVRYEDPEGNPCQPTQGQAFFYFGDHLDVFARAFEPAVGFIVTRYIRSDTA